MGMYMPCMCGCPKTLPIAWNQELQVVENHLLWLLGSEQGSQHSQPWSNLSSHSLPLFLRQGLMYLRLTLNLIHRPC